MEIVAVNASLMLGKIKWNNSGMIPKKPLMYCLTHGKYISKY